MTAEDPPREDRYPGDDINAFEQTVLRGHGRAADVPGSEPQRTDDAPDPPLNDEPAAEGYADAAIDPFEQSVLRGHGRAADTPGDEA